MSDDIFFCIKPVSAEAGFDAIMLVAEYDLKFSMLTNDDGRPGVIVVHKDENDKPETILHGDVPDEVHEYYASDYRLAEMAFQMNYGQVGMVCPVCEKKRLSVCGHLTFSRKINSIF